jgi:hypothetical protein
MQLYERLTPDEVDIILMMCGYEVSPTGDLSRRYMVIQLDKRLRTVLEALATSHGRTLESEASRILAAELRRLGSQSGGRD